MIQQIINQNIWWQDKSLISHDPKIKELNTRKFQWRPSVLDEFDLKQSAIYTLRGPRQVGKTTALKILISELLQKKTISKEQIMYYSCDNIDSHKELIELLETYLDHLKKLNLHRGRLYIFLDEITSITGWQKGIKYLADLGRLSNAGVVLTGSNASDLRKGIERLPGRRGRIAAPDKIMLPLGFAEYVRLTNPELFKRISERFTKKIDIFNPDNSAFQTLLSLQPHLKELTILFDQFLITGGFITAINAYFSENEIGYAVYELYQQWLRGDISKAGRNERTARHIINELIKISASAFGWETIAKKIGVATHKTVSEYIENMEDAFVLKTLYQVDINTGMPRIKKLKKVYFLDSFIFWSLWGWVDNWLAYGDNVSKELIQSDLKARLVEQVIADELFCRYDRIDWLNSNVFFWKNSGEIDFIIKKEKHLLPVEVKHRRNAGFSDFKIMKKLGFKKGILISMDRLDMEDNFVIMPPELFLIAAN
ncbi:MAG: ATP-binding protein [Nitrospirae bacterium]|nr:ATP-binding protein [Nitrospirota bacterium]